MFIKDENGNISVLVAMIMLVLIVSIAFVTDIGMVYAEKVKLSKALDASIMAGGLELPKIENAENVIKEYLVLNGVSLESVTINIAVDGMSAEVIATKPVKHYFATLIGFDFTDITENAKIRLGTASSATTGLRPFGVTKFDFQYGDEIILKAGAGDGYHGNYGALSLGGTGANLLLDNSLYGYDGTLSVGQFIYTETGNMASVVNSLATYINSIDDTFETYTRSSEKLWTIPLFDTMEVDGKALVEIVGFAQFYVENVTKDAGKAEMHGRFVKYVTSGDIDDSIENTGVYGVQLYD